MSTWWNWPAEYGAYRGVDRAQEKFQILATFNLKHEFMIHDIASARPFTQRMATVVHVFPYH